MLGKVNVLFCVLLAAVSVEALQMKLDHRMNEAEMLLRQGKIKEYVKNKEQSKLRANRFNKDVQPLYEYTAYYYTTTIGVGTPQQQFTMVVDFNSADFWVPDKSSGITIANCTEEDKSWCFNKTLYDSSLSSTYKKDGHAFLNDIGKKVGFLSLDTVTLGSNFRVPSVKFGRVNNFDRRNQYDFPNKYMDSQYDGAMGVGLFSPSNPDLKSAFQLAIEKHLINKPVITLWPNRTKVPAIEMTEGAQLTLGDFDPAHCSSDVTYLPVVDNTNWGIQIDKVSINDKASQDGWIGGIGYGSGRLRLPNKLFLQVVKELEAQVDPQTDDLWYVDCARNFTWTFTVAGKDFVLDKSQLRWENGGNGKPGYDCTLIFTRDMLPENTPYPDDAIVLGQPFTDQFCYIYDFGKKQIGLAKDISK